MSEEAKKRRPFHESVVDAIQHASYSDMRCLVRLIQETAIPKGHDEIHAAWARRAGELIREMSELGDVEGVLLEQKREAEEKEKIKQRQMDMVNSIS